MLLAKAAAGDFEMIFLAQKSQQHRYGNSTNILLQDLIGKIMFAKSTSRPQAALMNESCQNYFFGAGCDWAGTLSITEEPLLPPRKLVK